MIHLAGFTCCLGGVALYLLTRSTGRDIKSITRVYQLKDLGNVPALFCISILGGWVLVMCLISFVFIQNN
jgi:hypothetical protein